VLVRAGDGEWLQLRPVDELPAGGLRAICGSDAASLLELDEPLPVAAFSPDLDTDSPIDAVCLTADGGIALLVATFGETPEQSLWRVASAAGQLRGSTLQAFASRCSEVPSGRSLGTWLATRVAGNAEAFDARIAEVLRTGAFDLVVVTADGPGSLGTPLRFLQAGPARVRVYEVEILRAGSVQAIEGVEVTVDGEHVEPAATTPVAAAAAPAPAPQPAFEVVAVEPEPEVVAEVEAELAPEPEFVAEVVPELELEVIAEGEPEPEPEPEPALPAAEPSDERAFLAAVDRLDHRSSAHVRVLHRAAVDMVDRVGYTREDGIEFLVGWIEGDEPRPLLGLDSRGSFNVVLGSLPEHEQEEFAAECASLMEDVDGSALLDAGIAELHVDEHLVDETIMEYLLDNLVEALPGGRDRFQTHRDEQANTVDAAGPRAEAAADESEDSTTGGEDFFAGVSGSHEPSDGATELSQQLPSSASSDDATQGEGAAPAAHRPGGFGRRLRRRDAA
jgi:hypothetical protein